MQGLVIDTSSNCALLGLIEEGQLIHFEKIEGGKGLSERLFPALAQICELQKLSYLAVGIGPGSFIGLRTGATIAKTLAFALKIPLVQFPSPIVFIPEDILGPFIYIGDAKMGELFAIRGISDGKRLSQITPPKLIHSKEDLSIEDYTLVEGAPPTLKWAAAHTQNALIQNKPTFPQELELIYLR